MAASNGSLTLSYMATSLYLSNRLKRKEIKKRSQEYLRDGSSKCRLSRLLGTTSGNQETRITEETNIFLLILLKLTKTCEIIKHFLIFSHIHCFSSISPADFSGQWFCNVSLLVKYASLGLLRYRHSLKYAHKCTASSCDLRRLAVLTTTSSRVIAIRLIIVEIDGKSLDNWRANLLALSVPFYLTFFSLFQWRCLEEPQSVAKGRLKISQWWNLP